MKKLIAFDLDDTLAVTKRPISDQTAERLAQLADLYEVCVITGGIYKQVQENVIDRLKVSPSRLAHLHFMPVNGAQYHHFDPSTKSWQFDRLAEDLTAKDKQKISETIERVARELGYWESNPAGPIIADRESQITFSALGQLAEPKDKYAWDPNYAKRQKLYDIVSKELPDFEVRINGNTSLDVTRPGIDKGFGIEQLRERLQIERSEILFVGDQLQEGGNDYPIKALGIDTINVQNTEQTQYILEGLINTGHKVLSTRPDGSTDQLTAGLEWLVGSLVAMQASSGDDLNRQIHALLEKYELEVLSHHNTTSTLFKFMVDGNQYGLKVGYGTTDAVRDEARWYELVPPALKPHHIMSHIAKDHAFVLLKWLGNARTIEEIAIATNDTGSQEAVDCMIKALQQDRELFNSNPTVPLFATLEHSFFLDKYHTYNAGAKDFPYLQALLKQDEVYINGKKYHGPYKYVQAVQQNDHLRTYLSPDRAGLIHGDANADNLLVQDDVVYMIDPKAADHLPLEYDTGRFHWSLTGWNAITRRGQYTLNKTGQGYDLDIVVRQPYIDGLSRFRACFTDQEYHRAMYSSAMQYLTRIHHAKNEDETTALYLRGLQVFDDLLNELDLKI